jgi:hypothetical protein
VHHIVTNYMLLLRVGDGEDRARRINRPRPEADQQLVHQPEETALEAVRGHAIRDDGRLPSAECRRTLHGRTVHGRRHVSPRSVNDRTSDLSALQCRDIVMEFLQTVSTDCQEGLAVVFMVCSSPIRPVILSISARRLVIWVYFKFEYPCKYGRQSRMVALSMIKIMGISLYT